MSHPGSGEIPHTCVTTCCALELCDVWNDVYTSDIKHRLRSSARSSSSYAVIKRGDSLEGVTGQSTLSEVQIERWTQH